MRVPSRFIWLKVIYSGIMKAIGGSTRISRTQKVRGFLIFRLKRLRTRI